MSWDIMRYNTTCAYYSTISNGNTFQNKTMPADKHLFANLYWFTGHIGITIQPLLYIR